MRFDVARDVARDQRGAGFFRVERRNLLVDRADARALRIVEHRAVHRTRDMVQCVLGGRAHVDDLVEAVDPGDGGSGGMLQKRSFRKKRVCELYLLEERRKAAPYVFQEYRLGLRGRMQVILLKQFALAVGGDAVEQEGH